MKLEQDLAYAVSMAHHLWWDIAPYFGIAIIKELHEAYADLQITHEKRDASVGILKMWHQFLLEDKASRFVSKYGRLHALAVAAKAC